MTIAHIDTQMTWRGGQRQVVELIKGLSRLGQSNFLICRPGSKLSERSEKEGISLYHVTMKGEWDISSVLSIRSFIKKNNVDILHAHTSHAHTLGVLALTGIKSCRLVVTRRVDFHVRNPLSRKLKYGSRVDRILTVSDAIRRILIEDGVDPKLLTTVRSGFAPGNFSDNNTTSDLRRELGILPETVVIVNVAALAPHKAHTDLLKAARYVKDSHPNVQFLIAGDGELRQNIENQIKHLSLENNVHMLGFVEDIESVFRAADIFAITSEEEGLCTSIMDAMFFGLPIVATSAGGIPEIVHDQQNGYIVPVHDYMSFGERLNTLIDSPERRKKMGEKAKTVVNENTVAKTIEQTLAVYHDLFRNHTPH